MPIRFAILSAARSGTSLLTSTLNTHPDILCHGEIFHAKHWIHLKGTLRDMARSEIESARVDLPHFLQMVFHQPQKKIVGFKMWRVQHPDAAKLVLQDTNIKVIILERANKLAQASSVALAKQTGIWNVSAKSRININRAVMIRFDQKKFRSFVRKQHELFEWYKQHAQGEVIHIDYASLSSNGFHEVLSFLGADPLPLIQQKQKLHTNKIIDRYAPEDHFLIKETLAEIGHPEWVIE